MHTLTCTHASLCLQYEFINRMPSEVLRDLLSVDFPDLPVWDRYKVRVATDTISYATRHDTIRRQATVTVINRNR